MKYIVFYCFLIFLFSCSTTYSPIPDECYEAGLVDFAYDIAENPDKLFNLDRYYPQYYDPNRLFVILKDSSELNRNVEKIKKEFCNIDEKMIPVKLGISAASYEAMSGLPENNFEYTTEMFLSFGLLKPDNNVLLDFIFLKIDSNRYNILRIKQDILEAKF